MIKISFNNLWGRPCLRVFNFTLFHFSWAFLKESERRFVIIVVILNFRVVIRKLRRNGIELANYV